MPIDYNEQLRVAYLQAAVAAQVEVEDKIAVYRDFYDGEQGVLLTDRQKEYLTGRGDNGTPESFANMCKAAVRVPKDRLELTADGIKPADPNANAYATKATDWWNANQMTARQKETYEAALRDGNVAVIVEWDGEKPTFTSNLVYDGETGLVRFHWDNNDTLLYVSKRWKVWDSLKMGETGKTRLNLYMPDRIERYIGDDTIAGGWRWMTPAELAPENGGMLVPNPQLLVDAAGAPLGIPVFPMENPGGSEIEDVLTIQKLLNHNLGTFDEAVDLHNWPILWGAGLSLPIDKTTGKKYVPSYGAGRLFELAADGKMGRIDPANLEMMFKSGVMSWMQLLAIVKSWPIFVIDHSQQPPSGVALRIMESGLVSQVNDKHAVFGGQWLKIFDMGRKLHRLYTREDLAGEIELEWQPAETQDEKLDIETKAIKWEKAEIPKITRWRECGYTEDDIEQMLAEDAQQQAAQMNSLAAAMLEQQRNFDQGADEQQSGNAQEASVA